MSEKRIATFIAEINPVLEGEDVEASSFVMRFVNTNNGVEILAVHPDFPPRVSRKDNDYVFEIVEPLFVDVDK
jgi:hypothetical protein